MWSLNAGSPSYIRLFDLQNKGKTKMYWSKAWQRNSKHTGPFISVWKDLSVISMYNVSFVCVPCAVCICLCVVTSKQTEVASGSMKRSVSTVADQRVNGLWQEEKSPERVYRPRHKSYKAAGNLTSQRTHARSPLTETLHANPSLPLLIPRFRVVH